MSWIEQVKLTSSSKLEISPAAELVKSRDLRNLETRLLTSGEAEYRVAGIYKIEALYP
jgi:hypothetical protein